MTISADASSSMAASSTTVPASIASSAKRTTRRGFASGRKRGMPGRRDQQRDRERQQADAGVDRRQPERHRQEQRDDEEHAGLHEVLEEEHPQTADAAGRCRSIDGRTSGSAPRRSRRDSHSKNSHSERTARPRISHSVAEMPNSSGASGFGVTQPQTLERSTPNTARPRPAADSTTPTTSIRGRSPGGSSAIRRVEREDPDDDQHLAGEHQPPAQVGREQAADQRADGDRDRSRRHHRARRRAVAPRRRSWRRPARRSPGGSAPRPRPPGTTSRTAAPAATARSTS